MTFFEQLNEQDRSALRRQMFLFAGLVNVLVVMFIGYYALGAWRKIVPAAPPDATPHQLSVSGEGKVEIRPDTAVFTATIITQAKGVGDAQSQNDAKTKAVVEYLKKQGVPESDIRTVQYAVSPQYQYDATPVCFRSPCPPTPPPRIASYQVESGYEIRVRDFKLLDTLLGGVVDRGANQVSAVNFRIGDEERVRADARTKAIAAARQKAERIAADLGVGLGAIISFNEDGASPLPYARLGFDKSTAAQAAPSTPSIEPGQQEIIANVTVIYMLR